MFRKNSVAVFLEKLIESAPKTPALVLSRIGGGKTQIFKTILKTLINHSEKDPSTKIVITDQEGIFFSELPVSDKSLILLDPLDSRSACWDLAKDLIDIDEASLCDFSLNIVESIYGKTEEFWNKSLASELVESINQCRQQMVKTGIPWQWKDLKNTLAKNLRDKESSKTNSSVSLMAEKLLSVFGEISEAWEKDPTRIKFSFKNWFNQEPVNVWRTDSSDLSGKNILVLKKSKDNESFFPLIVNSFMSILLLSGINDKDHESLYKPKCSSWVLLDEAATIPLTQNVFRKIFSSESCLDSAQGHQFLCSGVRRTIQFVFGYHDLDQVSKQFGEYTQKNFLHAASGIILGRSSMTNESPVLKRFGLSGTLSHDLGPQKNGILTLTTICGEWNVRKILWPYVVWKEVRAKQI